MEQESSGGGVRRAAMTAMAVLVIVALTAGMAGASGRADDSDADFEAFEDAHAQISQEPYVAFTPERGMTGEVTFKAGTSADEPDVSKYEWDVGADGSIERTGTSPTAKLTLARGTHDVRLTVTLSSGVRASRTQAVRVVDDRAPNAGIWFSSGTPKAGVESRFSSSASDPDDPSVKPASFEWDFGDGTPRAASANPLHTYAEPGRYRVALLVTFGDGQTARDVDFVDVRRPQPSAVGFEPFAAAAGTEQTYYGSTSGDNGPATGLSWDFGDGTVKAVTPTWGSFPAVKHTYAEPGTYTITLTGTWADGTTARTARKVTADDPDVDVPGALWAQASSGAVLTAEPATFSAHGHHPSAAVRSYRWDFGDGTPLVEADHDPEAGQDVEDHTFAAPGPYDITLVVTFEDGSTATYVRTVVVRDRAARSATVTPDPHPGEPGSPAPGRAVRFRASGADPDRFGNDVASYRFGWGDGSAVEQVPAAEGGSSMTASHTFATAGLYDVQLTVTFDDGSTASSAMAVHVRVPDTTTPEASFGADPGQPDPGEEVAFTTPVSTSPMSPAPSFAWTFGDGGTSTAASPRHTYEQAGQYKVTLSVTYAGQPQPATGTRWITVRDGTPPVAGMSWRPLVPKGDALVTVSGAAFDLDDVRDVQSWNWKVGDQAEVATADSTLVRRLAPGTHPVRLRAVFTDGSVAVRTRDIVVDALPAGSTQVSREAAAGETVATAEAPSTAAPVVVGVTSPVAGAVTLTQVRVSEPAPTGYSFFGTQLDITAPEAPSADAPLRLVFRLDPVSVPAGTDKGAVEIFRNGRLVPVCGSPRTLPCVDRRPTAAADDWRWEVVTLRASAWNVGVAATTTTGGDGTGGGGTGGGGTGGGGTGAGGGASNDQGAGTGAGAGTGTGTGTGAGTAPGTGVTPAGTLRKQGLVAALAKGVVTDLACSAACSITATLSLDAKTAKRLRLPGAIGQATATMAGPGVKTVRIKLTPKARKALRRVRSVKLVLTVAGGGRRAVSTVTIKR